VKLRSSDTIVAIATPVGEGAISVVRVSGPTSLAVAERVFRGSHRLSETPGYTVRFGKILDAQGHTVDQVLATVFRSPNSYTGEDTVEISCHGGGYVTRRVLALLIEAGARQADPGEFTKRAFMNGKMDLSQAEAVADLIRAGSERALRNSAAHLDGLLSGKIQSIRKRLTDLCSLLEAQLDFSEEGITLESVDTQKARMAECREELRVLIGSYRAGRVIRDGVSVAIIGRPNVGKSSLFNRLLVSNRSIVSATPGTTRDFLEEATMLGGTLVKLVDTAGLRSSSDEVEVEGMRRTREAVRTADVVLLVQDATQPWTAEEDLKMLGEVVGGRAEVLVAGNKIDLTNGRAVGPGHIPVSALTGDGMAELRDKIQEHALKGQLSDESGMVVSSSRQVEALAACMRHLQEATDSITAGLTAEFVAADVRLAADSLAGVTGEITTDEVLNNDF
jgi:tRNA modification GTPase